MKKLSRIIRLKLRRFLIFRILVYESVDRRFKSCLAHQMN
ncbi:hypothetical protein D1BOALGB6SA_5818 [Olavius sp. associated proteobacterium Delta 1]|nr:hypothetical protein D1BOALGB6SA_5818 [Olavius sp. associated proteobacterium Delta 1]